MKNNVLLSIFLLLPPLLLVKPIKSIETGQFPWKYVLPTLIVNSHLTINSRETAQVAFLLYIGAKLGKVGYFSNTDWYSRLDQIPYFERGSVNRAAFIRGIAHSKDANVRYKSFRSSYKWINFQRRHYYPFIYVRKPNGR